MGRWVMMNNVAGRDKGGQTGWREGEERVGDGSGWEAVGEIGGGISGGTGPILVTVSCCDSCVAA